MPAFDRRHGVLLAVLTGLFLLFVSLGIHGWSLPMWHEIIDGSPAPEVLRGQARDIRGDDWLLDLPLILAQQSHRPRFPVINGNIGEGQNMLAPYDVPVWHPLLLLRPFTWGFLLGPDTGAAWMWWGLSLGVFYSFFLVFLLLSDQEFWVSLCLAAALLFSPYLQFWSLHKSEIAIHWAWAFVSAACLLRARRPGAIWAAGLGLGYSLAGMAVDHVYPPHAVTLGWLLPISLGAWLWPDRHPLAQEAYRHRGHRITAFLSGLLLAAAALLLFVHDFGEAFTRLAHTRYPGQRFSAGGGFPFWALFSQDFLAQAWGRSGSWLGNPCEDASFIFSFPLLSLLALLGWSQGHRRAHLLPLALSGYVAFLLVYTYHGFPDWLAVATGMGHAASNRTQLALGLADAMMLASLLSTRSKVWALRPALRWSALAAWGLLLSGFGVWMRARWADLTLAHVALGVALNLLFAWGWLVRRRARRSLAALALVSVLYTGGFNPWVRGGTGYLYSNPLSRKILEIDRERHGASRWMALGDAWIGNLFRILGVGSLGGYHTYPHFRLWRGFDPEGRQAAAYNQVALVGFYPSESLQPRITAPAQFAVDVFVHPDSPALAAAGVSHILAVGSEALRAMERSRRFRKLSAFQDKAIFRRVR